MEYITQFADIPFQKNPRKRPACTYCKSKKLRCVFGASNSCSQCERQGVECSHGETNNTLQDPQSLLSPTSQPLDAQSSNQSQAKPWQQQQEQHRQHQQLQQKQQPNQQEEEEDLALVHDSDSSCYIGNSIDNDPRTPISKTNNDLAIDLEDSSSGPYSGDYILPDLDGSNDYLDFLNLSNNNKCVFSDQQPNNGTSIGNSILLTTMPTNTDNHNRYQMTGLPVRPLDLQDWLPVSQSPTDFEDMNTITEIHQSRGSKEKSQPQQHLQQQSSTGCCCIDDILAANEEIQLQLVSEGHCSTTNIDNTLQCQKNVLTCIEGLLECLRCSSRSDYITLTISVCRGVMTSVINVIDTTINPVLTEAVPSSSLGGVKRSGNGRDDHTNRGRSGSHNSNLTGPNIGNDSSKMMTATAGGWRLDDYEEMQIAWNLFNLRVSKLQRLIQQLEQVAIDNKLGCIRVVQAMRRSFESRIAAMKPAKSRLSWEAPIENTENR